MHSLWQCLATASADSTIKIWALSDFSCVKVMHFMIPNCLQWLIIVLGTWAHSLIYAVHMAQCFIQFNFQTFEGHESSVLRVQFITRGMQLLSRLVGLHVHFFFSVNFFICTRNWVFFVFFVFLVSALTLGHHLVLINTISYQYPPCMNCVCFSSVVQMVC